ncbi:uncharacterized protein LOC132630773 [Lycium barbarum]|uniref:uncharacterized protein LOC132630773 n=1 Tax=Lycium barbarum TaxID=112863 RepID=UPI00293F154F|nr:uncharacterized protein LOC132630773 [Lycium barbarum]
MGMVDGSCKREIFREDLWSHWHRVNAIVLSWLMNSVSKSLLGGIGFASSAHSVWEDLAERFDRIDGSRTFNLHREIATFQQGTSPVSMFYTRLKVLWVEFEALVPTPASRIQILLMDPLPNGNHTYANIIVEESQKSVHGNTSGMGMNSVIGMNLGVSGNSFNNVGNNLGNSFGNSLSNSFDPSVMY